MKHILVAFDGSEPAGRAFEFGVSLADKFGSAIHVLAVARPPEPPEEVETEAAIESAREHYQQQFAVLQARAAKNARAAGISLMWPPERVAAPEEHVPSCHVPLRIAP